MKQKELYDFVNEHTARCRILVAGDVMLDKYYYSEVTRISPEALCRSPTYARKWRHSAVRRMWRTT